MNKKKINKGSFIMKVILGFVLVLIILVGIYLSIIKKIYTPVTTTPENKLEILGNKEDLVSFSVNSGETVSGILNLSGSVKNAYFFEANIRISLLDENQNVLKEGHGTATTDWMTVEPVSFTSTIDSTGLNGKGYILIQNDDPSGGEGGPAKKIFIPVVFENKVVTENKETMTVKVYFGDTVDAQSCFTPSYVERIIPKTTAVARASIEELLKGPTEAEKLQDRWTGLNSGISIKSLIINNGIAYVDFSLPVNSQFNSQYSVNACKTSATLIITNQIESTLKQFSTVKSVVITVNGKPMEDFFDI